VTTATMHNGRRYERRNGESIYSPSCAVLVPQLPVQNFMAPGGKPFEFANGITIPAIGASATVVQFTVPKGQNGFVRRIANVFVGGGFTDFSGAIIWKIFLNLTQNIVAPNFDNIIASLGSVSNPTAVDGIHVMEGNIVALQVTNVSVVVSGQLSGGRLGGSFHPIPQEPENLAF
jgi:hypothetical protein